MVAEPPRRRPRLVGVIVIGLIAVIAIAVIASLSLDEGETDPIEIDGAGDVRKLVGGIPQLGDRLGEDDAPITIEVFNDVQCIPCAEFQRTVIDPLIADEVRAGAVKLVIHHYSMSERLSGAAALGAVAAGLQDQQWQFMVLFLRNQDEAQERGINDELLEQVANGVLNLNVEQWQRDLDDPEVADILEQDDLLAIERRIPAEPAVVVQGPGGERELVETPTLDQVRAAIDEVR